MSYMSTVIILNTYLQSLHLDHQCRGYIQTYMCVHDFEKIIILMEVKTQEQVLKLFSACVVIISIQRNEQNTRFKH